MIVTADGERAAALRRARNYGKTHPDFTEYDGINTRLDDVQAAMLAVKLPHLDAMNERRRALASRYRDQLAGLPVRMVDVPEGCIPNYHVLTVRVPSGRDALRATLETQGIQCTVFYPVPVYEQAAFRRFRGDACPEAERACREVLSLPLYPEMPEAAVERVVGAMRTFFGHSHA